MRAAHTHLTFSLYRRLGSIIRGKRVDQSVLRRALIERTRIRESLLCSGHQTLGPGLSSVHSGSNCVTRHSAELGRVMSVAAARNTCSIC